MRIRCAGVARVVVAVVVIVAIAGCGSSSKKSGSNDSTSSSAAVNPSTAPLPDFYTSAEAASSRPPGTLLESERVSASNIHGTVYRVLYQSLSTRNEPVVVSGVVIVPTRRTAPATGYPVVTWGHGTTGLGDNCAPSLAADTSSPPPANAMLDRGWEIATSDYVGLGTPGVTPYLAGTSAARNVIDIVRAARQLSAAHASDTYAVWGYSEGGQTAMFALNIAATYAPELHLVGVVAGAPPSQLRTLYTFLTTSRYRYYVLMLIVGMNAAYGDHLAPLDQVLTSNGLSLVHEVETDCVSIAKFGLSQPANSLLPAKLAHVTIASTVKTDPFTIPAWRRILMANDAGRFPKPSAVPLLIVQGGADEQIPPATTATLVRHECSIGQDVEQWTYPGRSHAPALVVSASDVVTWLADRFAGGPVPDPYVPNAQAHVGRTTCPA